MDFAFSSLIDETIHETLSLDSDPKASISAHRDFMILFAVVPCTNHFSVMLLMSVF